MKYRPSKIMKYIESDFGVKVLQISLLVISLFLLYIVWRCIAIYGKKINGTKPLEDMTADDKLIMINKFLAKENAKDADGTELKNKMDLNRSIITDSL